MFDKITCLFKGVFNRFSAVPNKEIMDNIRDAVVLMDSKHNIVYHNKPFFDLVGGDLTDGLVGKPIWNFIATANPYLDYIDLIKDLEGGQGGELAIRSADHTLALAKVKVLKFSGKVNVLIIENSSKQKERETKLIKEAKSDKLTSLLNRKGFDERLFSTINDCDPRFKVGVLFIDLDGFKLINDTFGHDAGDLMLVSVARRIESSILDFETAARIGGDEFVCIFPVCESKDDLLSKALRVLKAVAIPIMSGEDELVVKCSIGGALMNEVIEPDKLLKMADDAMYKAKGKGKNQVVIA